MKNKLLLFLGIILSLAFLTNLCYASEIRLICIEKGETVKFSECNPAIQDRTCTSDLGCKYCVSILNNGAFCPKSVNECNAAQLSCSYDSSNIIADDSGDETEGTLDDSGDETEGTLDDSEDETEDTLDDSEEGTSEMLIDLTDETEGSDDSIKQDSSTLLGASIGTKISVGTTKKDKNNDVIDEDEIKNKKTGDSLIKKIAKNKIFYWFMIIMTVAELITLFILINIKKKNEMKKLTEQEIKEISFY
ncbi:MAG TPA: hypothetical protein P5277_02055 [Candidatus Paceibacterota bacterium]|nr:hypothetical protein [Candidatus Paceibacterota bacterium]